jgi:sulfite exporter TauE/SafE
MSAPWYAALWQSDRGRTRGIVAAIGYVVAGLGFLTLALMSDSAVRRVLLGFSGIWMLWLGVTLALTLRHRRSSDR